MTGDRGESGTINFIVTLKTELRHRTRLPRGGTGPLGFLGNLLSDGRERRHAFLLDFAEREPGMTVRSVDKGWVSAISPLVRSQMGEKQRLCLPSPSPVPPPASCLNHFEPILRIESAVCSYVGGGGGIVSNGLRQKEERRSQEGASFREMGAAEERVLYAGQGTGSQPGRGRGQRCREWLGETQVAGWPASTFCSWLLWLLGA